MKTYHKVLGGRPLVYVLGVDSGSRVKEGLAAMVNASAAAGVPRPYFVLMDGSVEQGSEIIQAIGAQAISSYVLVAVSLVRVFFLMASARQAAMSLIHPSSPNPH